MKNEYAQWRKLDNAALAFPAVTGKNDTRVFRFHCELKEEIKEENLQEALERTLEKYPLFRAVLRKGLFWFYLERRDIPAVAKKDSSSPIRSFTFSLLPGCKVIPVKLRKCLQSGKGLCH